MCCSGLLCRLSLRRAAARINPSPTMFCHGPPMRIDPSSLISAQAARAQARPSATAPKADIKPDFEPINFRKTAEESAGPKTPAEAAFQRPGTRLDIKV